MKIAIVGFNVEGRATYDYFAAQTTDENRGEHKITICDQSSNTQVPEGVDTILGEQYLNHLSRFDLVIRTAGLPPNKLLESNPDIIGKISSHINEFLKASPTKNIIGVTGTKGKGTTSTLIAKMLEAAGKKVFLGGNIGVPPLTFLPELDEDSWVVLELSSFQLMDLRSSPHIAVCLMVVPEHLNWHSDMEDYVNAKSQLFRRQTSDDIAIYYAGSETSKRIASTSKGWKQPYMAFPGGTVKDDEVVIDNQVVCKTSELKLLGEHNWQNACAAVTTVWKVIQDIEAMRSVLISFSGLEHRLELVRELDGVRYYDDSFGTTPETAMVAVQAFSEPKVLILGGSDKGAEYDQLAQVVASNNVRSVLLIGDQASRLQTALEQAGFTNFVAGGDTMPEIVAKARSIAQNGDVVLLSTGCASFGMFVNYKDRGDKFKAVVGDLGR